MLQRPAGAFEISMQFVIQREIEMEARKRLRRQRARNRQSEVYRATFTKRTGSEASTPRSSTSPEPVHKHFDPIYCIRHRRFLAKSIWKALQEKRYQPTPSLQIHLTKSNGQKRSIDIFSIPDSAISSLMFQNIVKRNQRYYSAFSFAYRFDKTILDAVERIRMATSYPSVYLLNYDFSDFFSSINHNFLSQIIKETRMFRLSTIEKHYISSIIKHPFASFPDYTKERFADRNKGVPQGLSISLFLANVAAHPLDLELERRNGSFARYGDDCIVVAYSYEDAIQLKDVFENYSKNSGISINRSKALGVRILSEAREEMRSVSSFEFLGYRFSRGSVRISDSKIRSWKKSISRILYRNLIMYLNPRKDLPFNSKRIGGLHYDWDLTQCINEIRRFIYGVHSEYNIQCYLAEIRPIKRAQGATSYFCLVDSNEQFRELDGWLLNSVERALSYRARLLRTRGLAYNPPDSTTLMTGNWYHRAYPPLETRLPSFSRAWRAARKRWLRHGTAGIDSRFLSYSPAVLDDFL